MRAPGCPEVLMRIATALVLVTTVACSSTRDPRGQATASTAGSVVACTQCHGDPANGNAAPPLSVRGATATTDRAVGAHQQHLRGGAIRGPVDCSECHVVPPTATAPGHGSNATAPLTWGSLASAGGVTPSTTASPDGRDVTCATYCHGASFPAQSGTNHAPSWTRVDGSQAACGTCHGIPPPAPHPAVANGALGCNACHPGTVRADGTIDVAGGLHIDGTVEIAGMACTACHGDAARSPAAIAPAPPRGSRGETLTTDRAVGAHQAHLVAGHVRSPIACAECHVLPTSTASHPNGTPTVTFGALASASGATPRWNGTTCATYCHGATLPGGSAQQPTWTVVDGSQRQCGSCHGAPPPASSGHPSVGSALTGCATCHPDTVKPDGTIDIAGGKHIDGTVEVNGASCTSCHGDSTRSPASIAAAPPRDTQGNTATTAAGVGAHQAHLADGALRTALACTDCHTVPSDTAHAAQPLNLTWSALAGTGTTPTWNASTLTCTNYCHGATLAGGSLTSPVWTSGSSQAACGTCHGLPPSTGHHSTHAGEGIGCGTCHGSGYSSSAVNTSLHVNGVKDVASGNPPGWNPTTRTCSNACHGTHSW